MVSFTQFISQYTYSQIEIKGKLESCSDCKITAIVDYSDLKPNKDFIPAQPDQFGNFVFEFNTIHRPTVVLLELNTTKIPVYVEPNKKTWITIQRNAYGFEYFFEKNLVAENNNLKELFQQFGWLGSKEKGNLWFNDTLVSFKGNLYTEYAQLPSYLKVDYVSDLLKEMKDFSTYEMPSQVSSQYKSFIQTYIKHSSLAYLYNLLSKESLTTSDQQKITQLTYTNSFDVQDRSNPAFIPHLKSYVLYQTKRAGVNESNFVSYFDYVWQNASQIPMTLREEYLIYLIEENLTAENVQALKPTIKSFIKSLSDLDEMAMLTTLYEDAKQKADGRIAPNFELVNTDGKQVSLNSLRGQNVFLAFWSSSCKPCIEGMQKSVENKIYLKDANIKFVYISTDLSKATWLGNKYVKSRGSNDIHLYVGQSSIDSKEYNAITLPTYYFINKNGNFVVDFPKSWEPGFVNFVKGLR